MLEVAKNAFRRAVWESDFIGSRITLGFAEFFWGAMLLWPGESFSRPSYAILASAASENGWGVCFLISSFIQFTIILTNRMHSITAWFFAGWNFLFWGWTVWAMTSSVSPPAAALGGEIAMVFTAGWIWLRPIIQSEVDKP
jgi:hypothetical protein